MPKRRLKDVLQPDLTDIRAVQAQQQTTVQQLEAVASTVNAALTSSGTEHQGLHDEDARLARLISEMQIELTSDDADLASIHGSITTLQAALASTPTSAAVTALNTQLSALKASVAADLAANGAVDQTQSQQIAALQVAVTANANAIANLTAKSLWQGSAIASIGGLLIGGSVNLPIKWQAPAPDTNYTVRASASANQGGLTFSVSNQTKDGCTLTVTNAGTALLATGSLALVTAYRYA